MRKVIALLTVALVSAAARPALAIPQFQEGFIKEYVEDSPNKQFKEYVQGLVEKKQSCFICHQGKSKKNRNPYGQQVAKLLDKKKDKDNKDKIKESLEKVAKLHSDPKDDKSPTFGELIASGKLPGGPLDDVMKEPKGQDKDKKDE